jgi:hypothetical protein
MPVLKLFFSCRMKNTPTSPPVWSGKFPGWEAGCGVWYLPLSKKPYVNALHSNSNSTRDLEKVNPARLWIFVVIFSALTYLALLPYYYVGFFNDDATYLLAARSLLQGRYIRLFDPQLSLLTQFPPGYPLFLTLFAGWVKAPYLAVQCASILLTLLSAGLLWILLEDWFSPAARLVACSLFTLNPITLQFSTAVMSEPLYIFLSLLCLLLLRQYLKPESPRWSPWLLGLLLGWVAITRDLGILLVVSVGATLALSKRWRGLACILPLAILPRLFYSLNNAWKTGNITPQIGIFQQTLESIRSEGLGSWVGYLHSLAEAILIRGICAVRLPRNQMGLLMSFVMIAFLLVFLGMGCRSLLKNRKSSFVVLTWGLFVGGCIGAHSLYGIFDPTRYVFPLLPFLITVIVAGGETLCRFQNKFKPSVVLGCVILLLSYGFRDVHLFQKAYTPRSVYESLPIETYTWIQQHLPSSAIVLAPRPATFYLYTNIRCVEVLPANDRNEFHERLMREGISYALEQPGIKMPNFGLERISDWNIAWIQSQPEAYAIIYRNPRERTIIYRIVS